MDPRLRAAFNADFTPEKYSALVRCVNESEKWPADFRISETPIFLTREFTDEVTRAASEIIAATRTPEFVKHSATAVPKDLEVPNESAHPSFHVVDFAICAEEDRLVPRLIELQAFPSLFGFQLVLLDCFRKAYPVIPRNWTSSFGGIKDDTYLEILRRTIIADSPLESVVLLEIQPEKQITRVDFAATETFFGIRPVCVTKIKKRSRQLFYDRDGREVRIERAVARHFLKHELLEEPAGVREMPLHRARVRHRLQRAIFVGETGAQLLGAATRAAVALGDLLPSVHARSSRVLTRRALRCFQARNRARSPVALGFACAGRHFDSTARMAMCTRDARARCSRFRGYYSSAVGCTAPQ